MKEAAEIFIALCQATERPLAVQLLSDADLRCVSGLLGRIYEESDISGELLGLCLVEGHRRFCELTAEGNPS